MKKTKRQFGSTIRGTEIGVGSQAHGEYAVGCGMGMPLRRCRVTGAAVGAGLENRYDMCCVVLYWHAAVEGARPLKHKSKAGPVRA